jgi:aldose 1-epimerase
LLLALIAAPFCASALTRLEETDFGTTPDGEKVQQFTLRNTNGMVLKVIGFGATMTELDVPDRNGVLANVVLGTNTLDAYLNSFGTPASVMGRVANRIAFARFTLDGVEYRLPANAGKHTIHGGPKGFGRVIWHGEALPASKRSASVRFTYFSKDGDQGFPGNLTASVTYTLTDRNEVRLNYEATTDKATPINLTSHAYFNLGGHGGPISEYELWLAADRYTLADDTLIPTGEFGSVTGTPLDFTKPEKLGSRWDQLKPRAGVYDHNFVINKGGDNLLALAARVRDPESGRLMKVFTTQPGVQLYTGGPHAICLETQHYPDSINHPAFPSTVLRPGETFKSTTIFSFSAK